MNIFVHMPDVSDATAFYRAIQPMSQLRRIMPELNIYHSTGVNIGLRELSHCDVAFIQRPYNPDHFKLVELCKNLKVKVWLDYDDNLFEIPPDNPAHEFYKIPHIRDAMTQLLAAADIVSVSTDELNVALSSKAKKIVTIPNAFNDFLFRDKPVFKTHKLVCWRGSATHQRDLAMYSDAIIKCSEENPTWSFSFLGYNPWFITENLSTRAIVTPGVDLFKYHEILRNIHPNVFIVPLADNVFNHAKSNIAWLEATYAGAVTLAPFWEEWKKPGIYKYIDEQTFEEGLLLLMTEKSDVLAKMHSESWHYISENLRLSDINQKRKTLLENL